MARFIIDRDDPRTVEATSITAAVESYVRDHEDADDWSDRFDIYARAEGAPRWKVFPVTTRTEFIVTVGREGPGPVVESDDEAAR